MDPITTINTRYGEVVLRFVGRIALPDDREVDIFGARVASANRVPYNLVLATMPAQANPPMALPVRELAWSSFHLQSYHEPRRLEEKMALDWAPIFDSEEQAVATDEELPAGMWLSELTEKKERGARHKYYRFADEEYALDYVVALFSRRRDVSQGNGLEHEYEFDLVLNHLNFDVAVERLA